MLPEMSARFWAEVAPHPFSLLVGEMPGRAEGGAPRIPTRPAEIPFARQRATGFCQRAAFKAGRKTDPADARRAKRCLDFAPCVPSNRAALPNKTPHFRKEENNPTSRINDLAPLSPFTPLSLQLASSNFPMVAIDIGI
jgi:ribosomal protein L34